MRQILTTDIDDTGAYTIVRRNAPWHFEVHVFPSMYGKEWVVYEATLPREASRSSVRKYATEQEALLDGMNTARGLLDKEDGGGN